MSVDRHVYLIGMPGAGKSSVGRVLADMLELPFLDLDREIERTAGCSVPEIFRHHGEERFRELEADALASAAAGPPAVVSCGGGAPLRPGNQELMHGTGTVVWLNVPLSTLRRRLRDIIEKRPLVKDPLDLERLYVQRDDTYRRVADREVDADGEPRAVARAVLEVVR